MYSRELSFRSQSYSRNSSLCVCVRVPLVYKPSLNDTKFYNTHRASGHLPELVGAQRAVAALVAVHGLVELRKDNGARLRGRGVQKGGARLA